MASDELKRAREDADQKVPALARYPSLVNVTKARLALRALQKIARCVGAQHIQVGRTHLADRIRRITRSYPHATYA